MRQAPHPLCRRRNMVNPRSPSQDSRAANCTGPASRTDPLVHLDQVVTAPSSVLIPTRSMFMNKTSLAVTAAVTAIAATGVSLALTTALGQTDDNKLGKVHFETSCKPEAQKLFDRGMLYQHSFWYRASQKTFEQALKADPECAIAYWGIALSLLWNPHAAPAAKNLAEGSAALEKGKGVGAKTERERDYLAALGAMYADYDKVDHRTRLLAYAKAMEQLA